MRGLLLIFLDSCISSFLLLNRQLLLPLAIGRREVGLDLLLQLLLLLCHLSRFDGLLLLLEFH